jgi:hypothetical protein
MLILVFAAASLDALHVFERQIDYDGVEIAFDKSSPPCLQSSVEDGPTMTVHLPLAAD